MGFDEAPAFAAEGGAEEVANLASFFTGHTHGVVASEFQAQMLEAVHRFKFAISVAGSEGEEKVPVSLGFTGNLQSTECGSHLLCSFQCGFPILGKGE